MKVDDVLVLLKTLERNIIWHAVKERKPIELMLMETEKLQDKSGPLSVYV